MTDVRKALACAVRACAHGACGRVRCARVYAKGCVEAHTQKINWRIARRFA